MSLIKKTQTINLSEIDFFNCKMVMIRPSTSPKLVEGLNCKQILLVVNLTRKGMYWEELDSSVGKKGVLCKVTSQDDLIIDS